MGAAKFIPGFSRGGIVPAAAGGWALPASFGSDRVMTALTPGETVLPVGEKPSHIAAAVRDAIGQSGRGDVHMHFHSAAVDGAGVSRLIRDHKRDIGAVAAPIRSSRRVTMVDDREQRELEKIREMILMLVAAPSLLTFSCAPCGPARPWLSRTPSCS